MLQLEKLKIMLGIQDVAQDELLTQLLESAETDVLALTNRQTLPAGLLDTQIQLATIKYNRLGAEGEQSHSEGGISRTIYVLGDDLPDSIIRKISQFRRLKLVTL